MFPLAALVSSVVLALAGGAGTRADQPAADPVLTLSVTGRGWGHAVGMSQWGAYGYALRGATYDKILAHYYPGTELAKTGAARMRVLVVERAKAIVVGSAGPFTVKDGSGAAHELAAGSYRFGPGFRVEVDPDAPAKELPGPLAFTTKGPPLAVNGRRYRGTLEAAAEKGALRVVNSLGLEAYLLGVVPREVPRTWPVEALKAQAVAARSYALATRKPNGPFDVYADVRSQVYGGLDGESGETNAAVQATAGEVLFYGGKVATTYFFSTSGGKTMDISEAWPGSQPVPYLVSVDDPYDDASPYHTWGPVTLSGAQLKRALKLPELPVDVRVTTTRSGRAAIVAFELPDGSEALVPAATVRRAMGLRSTWFRLALLFLEPPSPRTAVFGAKLRLAGFTRGLEDVSLERRRLGGGWEPAAKVRAAEDASFLVTLRAQGTADYRLVAGKVRGAAVRVAVAPRVTLKGGSGLFEGVVRPMLPGTVVVLQRQEGVRWKNLTTAVADGQGAYAAQVEPAPGVYRARVGPRDGYAAGLSRTLSVPS